MLPFPLFAAAVSYVPLGVAEAQVSWVSQRRVSYTSGLHISFLGKEDALRGGCVADTQRE